MPQLFSLILVIFLALSAAPRTVFAKGTVNYDEIKSSVAGGRWDDVLRRVGRDLGKGAAEEQTFLHLLQAMGHLERRDWNQVIKTASAAKAKGSHWDDYADYFIAEARFNLSQYKQSRLSIDRITRDKTNLKLNNEARLLLAKVALAEGRFQEAKRVLLKLERSVRGTPDHADLLWELARAEKGLKNHSPFCRRLLRLYRDFPEFERTAAWGPFLDENQFEGKPSLCSSSWVDTLVRSRNLLLSGQVDRANREINQVEERAKGKKSYEIDRLKAQFLIHEGEVTRALEILAPYYQAKKSDISYLSVMASAATRAGDSATAIGTYLMIARLAPRSSSGRSALYQAAFLSYQFQDYDGATRRYREFLQKHPGSALAIDAEWHLSWIFYLKGQFDVAYGKFSRLRTKLKKGSRRLRSRGQTIDRIEYWMAMSQYRLRNFALAKNLFAEIVNHGTDGSYYTIVARQRLRQVEQFSPTEQPVAPKAIGRWVPSVGQRVPAGVFSRPMIAPPDSQRVWAQSLPLTEESEDKIVITDDIEAAVDAVTEDTESALIDRSKFDEVEELQENLSSSPDPRIVKRFEKARRLIDVGLYEWAKWELYEIEKKTRNKDYLRALMAEYEKIGQFHRSVQIAFNHFARARLEGGIENQRALWEKAYPKAFQEYVDEFSGKFDVPQEMIWSIMRAESTFRRDAVSPVGAMGLMQVMPKTGQKIAELMGERKFDPKDLLEPPTAIKMGTRYLQRLWRKFNGNRALVAGGYNAGPHRILMWLSRFGTLDLDEFIEHIPFLETRNYIKKVVSNYQIYSMVYARQDDVFPEMAEPLRITVKEPIPAKETWEDI